MAERAAVEPSVNTGFTGLFFYFPHIHTNKEESVGLPISGKATNFKCILYAPEREGKIRPHTPINFLPVRPLPYPHPPDLQDGSIRQAYALFCSNDACAFGVCARITYVHATQASGGQASQSHGCMPPFHQRHEDAR